LVIDTSAIVAIQFREDGYESLLQRMDAASILLIGAPTVLETAMVLSSRLKRQALPEIMQFLHRAKVEIVPFTEEHMRVAVGAHHQFGRGRHAAQLNFGDCLCYATAFIAAMPLLFTGGDFIHTDLEAA
jgi:ribonuclease VapC